MPIDNLAGFPDGRLQNAKRTPTRGWSFTSLPLKRDVRGVASDGSFVIEVEAGHVDGEEAKVVASMMMIVT